MSATAAVAASLATTTDKLAAQVDAVLSATEDRLRRAKTHGERVDVLTTAAEVLDRMEPRWRTRVTR